MVENNSKDLLKLETSSNRTTTSSAPSCLESKLFVCKKDSLFSVSETPSEKPNMFPVPKSQVLGKLKDFLGVMAESNKKLMHDTKNNPDKFNMENLDEEESEYIEMDLMLGVADLHTTEAVAAAERALAGNPPLIPLAETSSTDSESEGSNSDDDNNGNEDKAGPQPMEFTSKDDEKDSSHKSQMKKKPKKRSKIVELP